MHGKDEGGGTDDGPVYRRRFDAERPRAMSLAVVAAIESVVDGETAGDRPLHDLVDPDALDALFETRPNGLTRARGFVALPLADREVRVHADGLVEVYAAKGGGSARRQ